MIQLAVFAAIAVAAVVLLVRWLEPRMAFFPLRGETTTPGEYGIPFTPHTIRTSDGVDLRVWHLQPTASRALIVYFHGNGGNLSMWAPILSAVARRGYSVLAFDYRGYGLSTGRPTERGLYRDADAVLALGERVAPTSGPIVYWGRSLGGAVAAYAATRQQPAGIIIEGGFPDARSLFGSSPLALLARLATYRFPTAEYLNRAGRPVLVLHGERDSVIPHGLGRALFGQLATPKRFVTIAGGDHNDEDPADSHTYWTAVDDFVASVRRPL
jgi:fermentation-respiration switch protein FrsA (DUF1100 family)